MAESSGAEAIFAAVVAMFLGIVTLRLASITKIPYTVLLLFWGLAIGVGESTFVQPWHHLGLGLNAWQNIEPSFLFLLLAPPVLYHAAGTLPRLSLIHSAWHILMLGIIGVGTGTVMTAVIMKFLFPYGWTWPQSFLFGAIVAATDPVAAVSLLKQVHASEELTTVVDGEALVDDGIAAVLYAIFLTIVEGQPTSGAGYIKRAFRLSLGGPAVGIAFGLCLSVWLKLVGGNLLADMGMTVVAAYSSFHVADILGCSDILATVALGMFMAIHGWSLMSEENKEPILLCWNAIDYLANTLIFVVSGIIIAGKLYIGHQAGSPHVLTAFDYGWAVALWLLLLVVRVVNIVIFWPILARTGAGMDMKRAAATAWSGIRGFVGLILALMVYVDTSIDDQAYKLLCFFFMATTACLTIVIQGGAFEIILWALALGKSAVQREGAPMQQAAAVSAQPTPPESGQLT